MFGLSIKSLLLIGAALFAVTSVVAVLNSLADEIAAFSDSPQACSEFPRGECFQVAMGYYPASKRAHCLAAAAKAHADESYCDAIAPIAERDHCPTNRTSLEEMSKQRVQQGFGKAYFGIDIKDQCYSEMADIKGDKRFCDNIVDKRELQLCKKYAERVITSWPSKELQSIVEADLGGITQKYIVISNNPFGSEAHGRATCDLIPEDFCVDLGEVGQLRDKCIKSLAIEHSNINICFEIRNSKPICNDDKSNYSKANCIVKLIKTSLATRSMCDGIVHAELKRSCYDRYDSHHPE